MFSLVKEKHNRVTRQATDNKFSLPLVQTNYGKKFITFLLSKHGITFLRISDLLTQNVHLAQNSLHTYTASTRKFDELREIVVCVWQFFVDHELRAAIMEALHLETECFWHFVSGGGVLFSLAGGPGLELLPQNTLSLLLNALQWNLVI